MDDVGAIKRSLDDSRQEREWKIVQLAEKIVKSLKISTMKANYFLPLWLSDAIFPAVCVWCIVNCHPQLLCSSRRIMQRGREKMN